MRIPDEGEDFDSALPGIQEILTREAEGLDVTVTELQSLQERIPLPSSDEIARMRSGAKPLSRAAYLLGRLQRAMITVENIAADLRADAMADPPDPLDLGEADFNAIQSAVQQLQR